MHFAFPLFSAPEKFSAEVHAEPVYGETIQSNLIKGLFIPMIAPIGKIFIIQDDQVKSVVHGDPVKK
jgi:hypothetical protein